MKYLFCSKWSSRGHCVCVYSNSQLNCVFNAFIRHKALSSSCNFSFHGRLCHIFSVLQPAHSQQISNTHYSVHEIQNPLTFLLPFCPHTHTHLSVLVCVVAGQSQFVLCMYVCFYFSLFVYLVWSQMCSTCFHKCRHVFSISTMSLKLKPYVFVCECAWVCACRCMDVKFEIFCQGWKLILN